MMKHQKNVLSQKYYFCKIAPSSEIQKHCIQGTALPLTQPCLGLLQQDCFVSVVQSLSLLYAHRKKNSRYFLYNLTNVKEQDFQRDLHTDPQPGFKFHATGFTKPTTYRYQSANRKFTITLKTVPRLAVTALYNCFIIRKSEQLLISTFIGRSKILPELRSIYYNGKTDFYAPFIY